MRMKTELPFLTDTVSVCELLRDFSQAPCGAADPAGFVVHPRRAPPAVLSVDSKRRVQLPFLPAQLLPRALFTCQKKVDFFFPPCISAWQCNLVIPASAACRCSFMSSGKMLSQRSRLPRCRVPTFPCQPLLTAILGCWQETLVLVAKLFSRLTLPPSLSSLPGTIGVSLFSLARRSGAWRERGGPTVCAGPAGAPGCGQSPARLPGESSSVPRAAGPTPRDCAGQRLCPMGRRRGRFLRCLHPTSSGQAASLKPSSSRARKAAKQNRCASLCRENSGDSVSTCAGEGADRLAGPLSAYPA